MRVYGHAAEERAILERARGSRRTRQPVPPASAAAVVPQLASLPYPPAPAQTLQLLGTIDALLKAPPRPPRFALLKALAVLEEHRATEGVYSHGPPELRSFSSSSSLRSADLEAATSDIARRLRAR